MPRSMTSIQARADRQARYLRDVADAARLAGYAADPVNASGSHPSVRLFFGPAVGVADVRACTLRDTPWAVDVVDAGHVPWSKYVARGPAGRVWPLPADMVATAVAAVRSAPTAAPTAPTAAPTAPTVTAPVVLSATTPAVDVAAQAAPTGTLETLTVDGVDGVAAALVACPALGSRYVGPSAPGATGEPVDLPDGRVGTVVGLAPTVLAADLAAAAIGAGATLATAPSGDLGWILRGARGAAWLWADVDHETPNDRTVYAWASIEKPGDPTDGDVLHRSGAEHGLAAVAAAVGVACQYVGTSPAPALWEKVQATKAKPRAAALAAPAPTAPTVTAPTVTAPTVTAPTPARAPRPARASAEKAHKLAAALAPAGGAAPADHGDTPGVAIGGRHIELD